VLWSFHATPIPQPAPEALHPAVIRGLFEARQFFREDKDREEFLDRLGGILLVDSTGAIVSDPAMMSFGLRAVLLPGN
jgi:hypothetical protein